MQRYSKLFGRTNKTAREFDSVNATFLQKGGFIDQVMAGVYTFLPLGLRVLTKIENVIRKEMNKIGDEILMPSLAPKDVWERTGRLGSVDILMKTTAANDVSKAKSSAEYILGPTHEEIVTPLAGAFNQSYRDLPFAVYQIQTKFRNEARAKSGLLRGREFRMKDLYSFHATEDDLKEYYEVVKGAYAAIFRELGLGRDMVIALASGGDFTSDYSHEFQVRCEAGEDEIYCDESKGVFYNREVVPAELAREVESFKACEVGNIFTLSTKFAKDFDYFYTDDKGKKHLVWMGCYGIGSSRVMGVLAEKYNDANGLVWPESVAPYDVHLVTLKGYEKEAETLARDLEDCEKEVLWDDRMEVSVGEKFADADLIGIPVRIVVSEKSMKAGGYEMKRRSELEGRVLGAKEILNAFN